MGGETGKLVKSLKVENWYRRWNYQPTLLMRGPLGHGFRAAGVESGREGGHGWPVNCCTVCRDSLQMPPAACRRESAQPLGLREVGNWAGLPWEPGISKANRVFQVHSLLWNVTDWFFYPEVMSNNFSWLLCWFVGLGYVILFPHLAQKVRRAGKECEGTGLPSCPRYVQNDSRRNEWLYTSITLLFLSTREKCSSFLKRSNTASLTLIYIVPLMLTPTHCLSALPPSMEILMLTPNHTHISFLYVMVLHCELLSLLNIWYMYVYLYVCAHMYRPEVYLKCSS